MKKLLAGMLMLGLTFAIGCESNPGGPGATGNHRTNDKATSFKMVSPGAVSLKQGEKKEARIKLDRGKDFKLDVNLTFETPRGIHVEPTKLTVRGADNEGVIKVKADQDAPLGKNDIRVIGTPEKGEATTMTFDVKVEASKAAE